MIPQGEEEKLPEDNVYFGTVSDDSDIVTLEPPKLEEIGNQEEALIVKEAQSPEDFNMGSSSSSQYTFCHPETGKNSIKNTLIWDLRTPMTTFYIMVCFLTLTFKLWMDLDKTQENHL